MLILRTRSIPIGLGQNHPQASIFLEDGTVLELIKVQIELSNINKESYTFS